MNFKPMAGGVLSGCILRGKDEESPMTSSYAVEIRHLEDIESLRTEWDELATNVEVSNPFFESWMLTPALELLPDAQGVSLFTVKEAATRKLIGFFPVKFQRRYKGVSIRCAEVWRYAHCYFGAPLVRKGEEEGFWTCIAKWLNNNSQGVQLLRYSEFPCHTTLERSLVTTARLHQQTLFQVQTYQRASLEAGHDPVSYRKSTLGKRAKQFRQKEKKLGHEGEVRVHYVSEEQELKMWIDNFLELEQQGWKGKEGTAMISTPHDESFFRQILTDGLKQNRLQMAVLFAGETVAAIRTGFTSGAYEYSFKIAYNEELAKYSPGVLLELKHAENFLQRPDMVLLDSCAAPNVRMLNQVLKNQREVAVYEVSSSAFLSRTFLFLVSLVTKMKRGLRSPRPSLPPVDEGLQG
jgi:CelD/BcsL family acetyltransferase involved in cellulose biosynthesis